MCLTRQPGARPTAIIFAAHSLWQATSMVVIEWIVKDCFASKGKAGAQAMFVLDIFLRRGAYSCAGMLLQPRLHKNWMHFMLDHQVQLQRDKQYLRWIFFLSDGNNPYKGVRWWIILRSGSQWSDVASVEKVLSSSEWTRALLGLANAPRPCFFPSITSINLSCGVHHPSAQELRHRIIPLASSKEFLCKICLRVAVFLENS